MFIGKIPQPLIGIGKDRRQLRVVLVGSAGNRELQVAMEIEKCLQATYPVEKLCEPDAFVYIVARVHKLRLDGIPDRDFQVSVDDFGRSSLVYSTAEAAGFASVLDDAAQNRMTSARELARPLFFKLRFSSRLPMSLGNQCEPNADEYADDFRHCSYGKFDQPGTHVARASSYNSN